VYREKAGLDGSTPLKTYASGWSAGCRDAFAAAKGWSCSTAWSTSNNPGVQSCLDRYLAKAGITTAQRQAQWTNTCVNLFKAEGRVRRRHLGRRVRQRSQFPVRHVVHRLGQGMHRRGRADLWRVLFDQRNLRA